jgi:hypothetical protein
MDDEAPRQKAKAMKADALGYRGAEDKSAIQAHWSILSTFYLPF